ncbi:MAG: CZB domain-containing protein [Magnetococcales bacterium]|nr:CZB domain-containing protein [Magnetococcales bacterium]
MKLQTKTIVVPTAIMVLIFLAKGMLFIWLIEKQLSATHHQEMARLVLAESRQLATNLELIISTQEPADAIFGLEAKDDGIAKAMMQSFRPLGLSEAIFVDKAGKVIHPPTAVLPEGLEERLSKTPPNDRSAHLWIRPDRILVHAPVIDVETRTGFLVFGVEVSKNLLPIVAALSRESSADADATPHATVTQRLDAIHVESEANEMAFVYRMIMVIGGVLLASLVLIILVQRTVAMGILRPLQRIMHGVDGLIAGHLAGRIPVEANRDELDDLATHINQLADSLTRTVGMVQLQSETTSAISEAMSNASKNLSQDSSMIEEMSRNAVSENDRVDAETRLLVQLIEHASDNMAGVKGGVDQLSHGIGSVAQEGENASSNVNTVASAAEQMSANLSEVNRNLDHVQGSVQDVSGLIHDLTQSFDGVRQRCDNAMTETAKAMRMVRENDEIMHRLAASASEIGNVVNIINSIAEQTNMLSLNAAIEAAGAGVAGAGFAVVAGEVKELARQTAEATSGISNMVEEIQRHSRNAMEAVRGVSGGFERINDSNQEIADSVNEQGEMVNRIADSMSGLRHAAVEVTRNAREIGAAAQDVSRSALEAAQSTGQIARLANDAAGAAAALSNDGQEAQERISKVLQAGQGILFASAEIQKKGVQTMERVRLLNGWIEQAGMLTDVTRHTSQAMEGTTRGLTIGETPFDVRKVKELHLHWLGDLNQELRGARRMNENTVSNHHECAFGKWYFGEGTQRFGAQPLFREVGVAHEEIHRAGQEALQLARQGRPDEAIRQFASLNDIRGRLFAKLDELYLWANLHPQT